MSAKTKNAIKVSIVSMLLALSSLAMADKPVFNLPEAPWSPTVISRGQPEEAKYLVSPSLKKQTQAAKPTPKPKPKRAPQRDPFFDDRSEFVSIEPMSISGRVSAPSLPFALERQKGTRTFHLPRLSPGEALRDSANQVR
jgi:hypothetical protein